MIQKIVWYWSDDVASIYGVTIAWQCRSGAIYCSALVVFRLCTIWDNAKTHADEWLRQWYNYDSTSIRPRYNQWSTYVATVDHCCTGAEVSKLLFIYYAIRQHKNTQNTHYKRKIYTLIKAIKSYKILNYHSSSTGLHFL